MHRPVLLTLHDHARRRLVERSGK